ncbi:MAG: glutathione S-transferase N-terminal domain-containing protein, partial [Myxococcales bacterium]|nr:glutathione S-transferase N-terminal domain-containing protein [Myxococcales bacterium]
MSLVAARSGPYAPLPGGSMLELVGRSSSHYTRVAQVFAHELGVPYRLVPVFDLTQLEADCYGDNPALKIPMLRESPDSGALGWLEQNLSGVIEELP